MMLLLWFRLVVWISNGEIGGEGVILLDHHTEGGCVVLSVSDIRRNKSISLEIGRCEKKSLFIKKTKKIIGSKIADLRRSSCHLRANKLE